MSMRGLWVVVEAVAVVAVEEVEVGAVVGEEVVAGEVVVGEEGLEEGEAETSTCWYRGAFDLRYRRSCTPSLDCFFTRAF